MTDILAPAIPDLHQKWCLHMGKKKGDILNP